MTTLPCPQYAATVEHYHWDAHTALAIMKAESGCNPSAYNPHNADGTNDAGLMQINSVHVASGLITSSGRFDPAVNIAAAYAIYRSSGWKAWSTYNNGRYERFM